MNKKLIIWTLVLSILISNVFALGVVPSSESATFESGKTKSIILKIINSEHENFDVVAYAEGSLSHLITIKNPSIEFSSKTNSELLYYDINMPENLPPGSHKVKIKIRKIPKSSSSTVSASLVLTHSLTIAVPYPGKYAEARLHIPPMSTNQPARVSVEIINLGDEPIYEAQAFVDIYSPTNTKLKTLISEVSKIETNGKKVFVIDWTPELNSGIYNAIAHIIYDGETTSDEANFNIGNLLMNIVFVEVNDFTLGQVAKFEILTENLWNTALEDVFVEMLIKDLSGVIHARHSSAESNINPFSKKEFYTYWDTQGVNIGEYFANIKVHYDEVYTEENYTVIVSPTEISLNLIGNVLKPISKKPVDRTYTAIIILTFLVVFILVFNIYVYFKKFRK